MSEHEVPAPTLAEMFEIGWNKDIWPTFVQSGCTNGFSAEQINEFEPLLKYFCIQIWAMLLRGRADGCRECAGDMVKLKERFSTNRIVEGVVDSAANFFNGTAKVYDELAGPLVALSDKIQAEALAFPIPEDLLRGMK